MSIDTRPLLEVSWEVANKVGGIHTVVSSKARLIQEHYEQYILIGPLLANKGLDEITEKPAPTHVAAAIDELSSQGIHCVYGSWNIPGSPSVVLIDANHASVDWDYIKAEYWKEFSVDTLYASWDILEPLRWASAAGMFINAFQRSYSRPVIAQFHEWMAGFGALHCRLHNESVATIFTTHATVLGRSMSSNTNTDIYEAFESLDPAVKAKELNVFEKHSAERACAQAAHVFTTVSEITAMESEFVLSRRPDVILPNGIVDEQFPDVGEETVVHRQSRERLRDFIYAYFFGNHRFDLDETLIFFTNGRYEYHNKGLDVLTDALGRLNNRLRSLNHHKRVVVFYFIPGDSHGVKKEVLQSVAAFNELKEFVDEQAADMTRRVLRHAHDISMISSQELLDADAQQRISELSSNLCDHAPALCTHQLVDEDSDDIISSFKKNGLSNSSDDYIKVIRMPVYLDGHDDLINLDMQEAAAGCHLGLFASYYEPWGYTPVESAANGTPAITTDLAGFGRFIREHQSDQDGVLVLDRHKRSYEDIVSQLEDSMFEFINLNRSQRAARRKEAKRVSNTTHWNNFITRYYQAHDLAYKKL